MMMSAAKKTLNGRFFLTAEATRVVPSTGAMVSALEGIVNAESHSPAVDRARV